MRTKSIPLQDYLFNLRVERDRQEFERYLAECKKDRKRFLALVLLFALSLTVVVTIGQLNIIPYATIQIMLRVLNLFSELASIGMTLFGSIFVIKHALQHKNATGGFKIVFPVLVGFSLTIYIAKALLSVLAGF